MGAWECDLKTEALTWTDGVYDIFGLPRGSAVRRGATLELYQKESRRQMERLRAEAIRNRAGFSLDAQIWTRCGDKRWMRLTAQVACEQGRPVRIFGAKQDITEEKAVWNRLKDLAERDPLTGLANRGTFETRFAEFARHPFDGVSTSALALVDLDLFKQINDRLGHAAGDECLRQVAARLNRVFDNAVLVARIGGDEFVALIHACLGPSEMAQTLANALRALRQPYVLKNARVDAGVSIGVSILQRRHPQEPAQLFAEADSALYIAKAGGGNMIRLFGEEAGDPLRNARVAPPRLPHFL